MMPTTRRQSVNFLGFLRGQLSGLQGIPTLCYELIQNADDVKDNKGNPAASKITFDIRDDALYVENNGVFRDIDFERMEKVSWGDKREEAGTTGAFGIGFISVYQITDSPEIFSSGKHWKFHPEAPEDERIVENQLETKHTKFCLPWAFEITPVRKALGISQVEKSELDGFAETMSEVIQNASLFLKQVKLLEVKRSGKSIRRIHTERENDWLLVKDGNRAIRWRILEGDFSSQAWEMRARHSDMIEEKRKSLVTIAVPEVIDNSGLLYAFLPSETRTGLPFHINADFYPSSDRKRILFETGFKSEWNNSAIECAARTFALQIEKVLEMFSPEDFWAMVENIKDVSDAENLSPAFDMFWEELKPQIRNKNTVLTVGNELLPPVMTHYPRTKEEGEASKIFEELGLPIVDPSLTAFQNLMTSAEIGVQILKLTTVAQKFINSGCTERTTLVSMPIKSLRSKAGWAVFLKALNSLRERTSYLERPEADALLTKCAIAFGSDKAIWPPSALYKADNITREIFAKFTDIIWFLDDEDESQLPAVLVDTFTLDVGIELLRFNIDSLPELWKNKKYSPEKIYGWLESFQTEIRIHNEIREKIRNLAIWPTSDGALQPLSGLFLAGDFTDPLNLAQLVDIKMLGGRHEFLENVLHVEKLDFVTYIRDWIPAVLQSGHLSLENRLGLLQVMAEYLGKLQGHNDLQRMLASLPIVWCGREVFSPAQKVCFDSASIKEVLGTQIQIAHLPIKNTESVRALYSWLGVAHEPRTEDILLRIKSLTSDLPKPSSVQSIEKIFAHIATRWSGWGESIRDKFLPLVREAWLPGTKNKDVWYEPAKVYTIFQKYLFESQGNFLKIDQATQQKGSELIKFLGIETEPLPIQVVRHLLAMSEQGKPVKQAVYEFLNRYSDDVSIKQLQDTSCLYLKTQKGDDAYFRPNQVFWEEHPFGYLRSKLGPEFGRFKDLFDTLGVKSKPDFNDAIVILLEIAEEFGKSNTKLVDQKDVQEIVITCWRLLSVALAEGRVGDSFIKKELGKKKTILDSRGLLEPPETLFFEDRPGLGSKFEIIKHSLIPRVEGSWIAMEAAGVQRISKAVTTEIHQCDNPSENLDMKKRLDQRKNLILRVSEAHRTEGANNFELEKLETLSFIKADRIEVVKTFTGFVNRRIPANHERVDAIYINDSVYFSAEEGEYPWLHIARELTYVLNPSGELSSLGMELKEIMYQSVKAASSMLDELGYPRIATLDITPVESIEISSLGGDNPPEGTEIEEGSPNDEEGIPHEEDGGEMPFTYPPTHPNDDGTPPPPEKTIPKKSGNRKTTRLVSYVLTKTPSSASNPVSDSENRRGEIGQIGVDRVMEYERSQGRDPIDMETIQVHHPGFDITSLDSSQKPRYIEVKSFTGIWDSQNPAQLTKTEFGTAQDKQENFWLYIVERVESDEFRIYRICNPTKHIDAYLFDHGWMHQATTDNNIDENSSN